MAKTKTATSSTVRAKPTQLVGVPMREVKGIECLALGLRTAFITCGKQENDGVYGGAGFGSPWIEVRWKGRSFAIHAVELLAAVVGTFDPEDAKLIEKATVGQGIGVQASSIGEED